MRALFNRLPFELKKHEIKSHLDEISLMFLQHTLLRKALPESLTWKQKIIAIQHGLNVTLFFLEKNLFQLESVTSLAAQAANLEVLKWSVQQYAFGTDPVDRTLELAAMFGHLHIVKWLIQKGMQITQKVIQHAALSGSIELIDYLLNLGCILDKLVFLNAIIKGHFNLIKTLAERKCPFDPSTVAQYITNSGNWKLLKWWQKKYNLWSIFNYLPAIERGDLKMVQWLSEQGAPIICSDAYAQAAQENQLEIIKYFRKENMPWDERTTYGAAIGSHFALLKWLHQKGCDLHSRIVIAAASNGNFEILQWAIHQGLQVTIEASRAAAHKGHVAVLDWLRHKNYPIASDLIACALRYGHFDLAKKLYQQGYKFQNFSKYILLHHQPEAWKWLLEKGYEFTYAKIQNLVRMNRIEALQWFDQHNLIKDKSSLTLYAAQEGRLHILQWMIQQNYAWNPQACYDAVCTHDVHATRKWIAQYLT